MEASYFKEKYEDISKDIEKAVTRDYSMFINPKISLLKFSENIICLIEDREDTTATVQKTDMTVHNPEEAVQKRRAVVRINRPNYHSRKELESELKWITQIRQCTDINTAIIYEGRNGQILQSFTSTGGYEYTYSIQSFVEGKTIKELGNKSYKDKTGINKSENGIYTEMEKVGSIAAKLHLLEEKNPHDKNEFLRFTWDIKDTLSEEARWGHFLLFDGLTQEDRKLFLQAAAQIEKRLENYGRNSGNYGLIHADLHSENLIADKGIISLIDFDDCGYSWYLYDLASAVSQQSYGIKELTEAYLKGYQEIRRLNESDIKETDTFILLRRLVRMGWMTTRKDNGVLEREGREYYKVTKEMAREFLISNGV